MREGVDFKFDKIPSENGLGNEEIAIPIEPETKIKNMKSGIELIAEERQEQIEKHGFSVIKDARYYRKHELIQAALFCLDQTIEVGYGLRTSIPWPEKWDEVFAYKILAKDTIGKLKVAGALIAAEIDRLQNQQP